MGHLSSAVAYGSSQQHHSKCSRAERGLGLLSLPGSLRAPTGSQLFSWHSSVPIALGAVAVRVASTKEINPSLCLNVSQIRNPFWFYSSWLYSPLIHTGVRLFYLLKMEALIVLVLHLIAVTTHVIRWPQAKNESYNKLALLLAAGLLTRCFSSLAFTPKTKQGSKWFCVSKK